MSSWVSLMFSKPRFGNGFPVLISGRVVMWRANWIQSQVVVHGGEGLLRDIHPDTASKLLAELLVQAGCLRVESQDLPENCEALFSIQGTEVFYDSGCSWPLELIAVSRRGTRTTKQYSRGRATSSRWWRCKRAGPGRFSTPARDPLPPRGAGTAIWRQAGRTRPAERSRPDRQRRSTSVAAGPESTRPRTERHDHRRTADARAPWRPVFCHTGSGPFFFRQRYGRCSPWLSGRR